MRWHVGRLARADHVYDTAASALRPNCSEKCRKVVGVQKNPGSRGSGWQRTAEWGSRAEESGGESNISNDKEQQRKHSTEQHRGCRESRADERATLFKKQREGAAERERVQRRAMPVDFPARQPAMTEAAVLYATVGRSPSGPLS